MTRENKRALGRILQKMIGDIEKAIDIIEEESGRLDEWPENLQGSARHDEACDLIDDLNELAESINDQLTDMSELIN